MRTKLQNLNNINEKKFIELFFISQLVCHSGKTYMPADS